MYVSVFLLALAHSVSSVSPLPAWQSDYAKSIQIAKESRKPVAVVIGSGQDGWKNISSSGALSKDVCKLLADSYVCTYVDATDPRNQKLVKDFDAKQFPTLVVSDRGGALQLHRQVGPHDAGQLQSTLQRLASNEVQAGTVVQQSYYQPSGQQPSYQPAPYYQPTWGGSSGGFSRGAACRG
jgi:hypothetical protein